jgi:flavin reductase (DIM6/NTAB) family NADH-FMN oxidoreductase RutF
VTEMSCAREGTSSSADVSADDGHSSVNGAAEAMHQFRSAMSELVAGVAAITVSEDGTARGMLATSISSYSDRPPSILVSLAHTSRTRDPLLRADTFGVHLLGREQTDVAVALAGSSDDKFTTLSWEWDRDVPQLHSVLGYLRCHRSASFEHHDHTIVIGDVEFVEIGASAPMVYFRRTLDWHLEQVSPQRRQRT